jgi:hypothetical protein
MRRPKQRLMVAAFDVVLEVQPCSARAATEDHVYLPPRMLLAAARILCGLVWAPQRRAETGFGGGPAVQGATRCQ